MCGIERGFCGICQCVVSMNIFVVVTACITLCIRLISTTFIFYAKTGCSNNIIFYQ